MNTELRNKPQGSAMGGFFALAHSIGAAVLYYLYHGNVHWSIFLLDLPISVVYFILYFYMSQAAYFLSYGILGAVQWYYIGWGLEIAVSKRR